MNMKHATTALFFGLLFCAFSINTANAQSLATRHKIDVYRQCLISLAQCNGAEGDGNPDSYYDLQKPEYCGQKINVDFDPMAVQVALDHHMTFTGVINQVMGAVKEECRRGGASKAAMLTIHQVYIANSDKPFVGADGGSTYPLSFKNGVLTVGYNPEAENVTNRTEAWFDKNM